MRSYLNNSVVIGVTGHRNINPAYADLITELATDSLNKIRAAAKSAVMLNGLAEGGDLLCARAAVNAGVKIAVCLPFEEKNYLNGADFSPEGLESYRKITESGAVIDKFVAPDTENKVQLRKNYATDGEKLRDYAFRQQSIYVSTHCDVLLALYDGVKTPLNDFSCGTAAAVNFCFGRAFYRPGELSGLRLPKIVIKINSPRGGGEGEITREFLLSDGTCAEYSDKLLTVAVGGK